jgi:ketosteroid isomerase-like protein
MTKTEIAEAFSNGAFDKVYEYIAADAEWTVVEEDKFIGKQAIVENCEQVGSYFKTVSTNFEILNIIADGNKVVINGTAEFLRGNIRVAFVSACDLYVFNENNQIQSITSYCIPSK